MKMKLENYVNYMFRVAAALNNLDEFEKIPIEIGKLDKIMVILTGISINDFQLKKD